MSNEAVIAARSPIAVEVKAGQKYWWCSCGKSSKQPFCDGSHKGGAFTPKEFVADKDETVWLCACKQTHAAPRCDGSHKQLPPG